MKRLAFPKQLLSSIHFTIFQINFTLLSHPFQISEISNINKEYFNKNGPTDVLSFPLFAGLEEINCLNPENEESLGDMFFCRPILKKNAADYGKDIMDELQLVLVHGLLHLVGYSHTEEEKMRNKENAILEKVWNEVR
tara:strand:+ start:1690 stop:2103 length:414 start_codon:yes stop_codon:yes gene_type:complete